MLDPTGHTLTVRVPMTFRQRGGRKLITMPRGDRSWAPSRRRVDSALIKAIVQAHRWKSMLETGQFASVKDLARAERINHSYLYRVLRLALLAPAIIEAILNGVQPVHIHLRGLLVGVPIEWERQTKALLRYVNPRPDRGPVMVNPDEAMAGLGGFDHDIACCRRARSTAIASAPADGMRSPRGKIGCGR
jgi:hypothetical protein